MASIHVLSAPPVLATNQVFKAPTELGLLGAGDVYYYHKVADNEAQLSKGVTGRPSLTGLIDLILHDVKSLGLEDKLGCTQKRSATQRRPTLKFTTARMSRFPALQVNGLSSVAEDPNNVTPTERTAEREDRKLAMLRRMRPPPLKYAWTFYHDKHSETGSYEGRLSMIMENIVTLKPFWGVLNNFPIKQLKMKDSVHFFKRGIKPVWEDSRNINGGSWTFRVPKEKSEQFWQEVLMMAVGEQFAPALQPRKSLFPHLDSLRQSLIISQVMISVALPYLRDLTPILSPSGTAMDRIRSLSTISSPLSLRRSTLNSSRRKKTCITIRSIASMWDMRSRLPAQRSWRSRNSRLSRLLLLRRRKGIRRSSRTLRTKIWRLRIVLSLRNSLVRPSKRAPLSEENFSQYNQSLASLYRS